MENKLEELPLVTVIVPVYNVAGYIDDCLRSLQKQTYRNLEIILVNDGSTDASPEICNSYVQSDSRFVLIDKKNGGISDARNFGMKHAKGSLITFVDSDDWVNENIIANLYRVMQEQQVDIVACENSFSYPNGKIEIPSYTGSVHRVTVDQALEGLLEDRKFRCRVWGRLYKRRVWENIEFPVGETYEDVSTLYKAYLNANAIALFDQPLYRYAQRNQSIVHSANYQSLFSLLNARKQRAEELSSVRPQFRALLSMSILSAVLDIYRAAVLQGGKLTPQEVKTLQSEIQHNSKPESIRLLSPRYRIEFRILSSSVFAYIHLEKIVDFGIRKIKTMGKNK